MLFYLKRRDLGEILLHELLWSARISSCLQAPDQGFQRAEMMLDSLTYSQFENGAQQKQNIFRLIYAKSKSLIHIGSFFAPSLGKGRKPA
jgi:hypothetical protein